MRFYSLFSAWVQILVDSPSTCSSLWRTVTVFLSLPVCQGQLFNSTINSWVTSTSIPTARVTYWLTWLTTKQVRREGPDRNTKEAAEAGTQSCFFSSPPVVKLSYGRDGWSSKPGGVHHTACCHSDSCRGNARWGTGLLMSDWFGSREGEGRFKAIEWDWLLGSEWRTAVFWKPAGLVVSGRPVLLTSLVILSCILNVC